MRNRPDQLGREGGAGARAPAPGPLWEAVVGSRPWFVEADIVVSPWKYTGCNTDDVQSVTSTPPDNPGYFHRKKNPSATGTCKRPEKRISGHRARAGPRRRRIPRDLRKHSF